MNFSCQADVFQLAHHRQYLFVSCNGNWHPVNMQKVARQFFIELLWLTASLSPTILLASVVLGWKFLQSNLDIHLHDTYFVISSWRILTPLVFLVTFIIYFIKEYRRLLSRALPNWIFLITGLTLIVFLTFLIQSFSQLLTSGLDFVSPSICIGYRRQNSRVDTRPDFKINNKLFNEYSSCYIDYSFVICLSLGHTETKRKQTLTYGSLAS